MTALTNFTPETAKGIDSKTIKNKIIVNLKK